MGLSSSKRTNDTQDRVILDDSNPAIPAQIVVAAWGGDSPTASYHGPDNVAQGSVRWYGTGDELTYVCERLAEKADGYFNIAYIGFHRSIGTCLWISPFTVRHQGCDIKLD
jgi:hypothetical protein